VQRQRRGQYDGHGGEGGEGEERAGEPAARGRRLPDLGEDGGAKRGWWIGLGEPAQQIRLARVVLCPLPALGTARQVVGEAGRLIRPQLGAARQHLRKGVVAAHVSHP
jgi:hypothetical protein